eukprot:Em0009g1037a
MDNESLEALRGELFPRKGFYQEKQETPSEIYSDESGFRLYIGDSGDARDIEKLDKKRITYVLNAAAGEARTEGIYGKHIKCLRLDIIDESWYDISKHIDGALEFIAEAKAKKAGILVHCVAGVSRSVTVAMAYFMVCEGWSLKKTSRQACRRRAASYPNIGFFKYLMGLDKKKMSGH